jgi:hypothetical protein
MFAVPAARGATMPGTAGFGITVATELFDVLHDTSLLSKFAG